MMLDILDTAEMLPETLSAYLPKLESGWAAAFRIKGTEACIVLGFNETVDTNEPCLWIEDLVGRVGFRPKANLRLMGTVLRECETHARRLGCTEIRIEANSRLGWKETLLPCFGFEPKHVNQYMVYRKGLLDG